MHLRKRLAAASMLLVLPMTAACSAAAEDEASSASVSTSSSAEAGVPGSTPPTGAAMGEGGPGASVDPSSVTTEEELVALIQDAYGDGGLDLHRGHQPVESVLDEVLDISHEELHERMDQGQNLAAVAEDLGVDPQPLIDALVDSWSPAIDKLVEDGTITESEAAEYGAALEDAFTFRVTWDGEEDTPTFSGLDA